jgi:hypothetical protein
MHWLVPVALVFTDHLGWALIVTVIFICME